MFGRKPKYQNLNKVQYNVNYATQSYDKVPRKESITEGSVVCCMNTSMSGVVISISKGKAVVRWNSGDTSKVKLNEVFVV